jgi:hypothetical protein
LTLIHISTGPTTTTAELKIFLKTVEVKLKKRTQIKSTPENQQPAHSQKPEGSEEAGEAGSDC